MKTESAIKFGECFFLQRLITTNNIYISQNAQTKINFIASHFIFKFCLLCSYEFKNDNILYILSFFTGRPQFLCIRNGLYIYICTYVYG